MSDPGFREIHLSGKQLVFWFMAISVAAVGVFLLGVSVGKGMTKVDAAMMSQATPSPTTAATDPAAGGTSESTKPKKNDLTYFNTLQGSSAATTSPTPTPAASPVQSPSPSPIASPAASQAAAKPTPTPSPDKPSPSPAAASGTWYVLVDTFGSRTNANTRLTELKKKGYTNAAIATAGTPAKPAYRVRVGPFDDKPAADAMKARLSKEGYKPSVIR